MAEKLKILIIDPDIVYGRLANSILQNDFQVEIKQSPYDAFEILKPEININDLYLSFRKFTQFKFYIIKIPFNVKSYQLLVE